MGMLDLFFSSDTKDRLREAKDLNETAEFVVDDAQERYDDAQKNCEKSLKLLEKQKTKVTKGTIPLFVNVFTKIKNIDYKEAKGFQELGKLRNKTDMFYPMVDMPTDMMSSSFARQAMVVSVGGAFGLVGLGVMRHYMKGKSQEMLDNAHIAYAQAEVVAEKLDLAAEILGYIQARSDMFVSIMKKLNEMLLPLVYRVEQIVEAKGGDYCDFDRYERQALASAMSLTASLKAVAEVNILNKDGSLSKESKVLAQNMAQQMQLPYDDDALGNQEAFPRDNDFGYDEDLDSYYQASEVDGYYQIYEKVLSVVCKVINRAPTEINIYSKFKELNVNEEDKESIRQRIGEQMHVTWSSSKINEIFESIESLVDYVDNEKSGTFSEIKYYGDVAKKALSNLFGPTIDEVSSIQERKHVKDVFDTSVFSNVKDIVAYKLGIEDCEIEKNSSFVDDLGADDLDLVEIMMELEKEFGITIPDSMAEKVETISDVVKLISREKH